MARPELGNRKRQICDAAIKLFLRKGVLGTSMRDIAAAMGASTGSLYYHFRSKGQIIDEVVESAARTPDDLRDYYKGLGGIPMAEALRKLIVYLVHRGDQGSDCILFFIREWRQIRPSRRRALAQSIRHDITFIEYVLDEGIRRGEFQTDNPRLVAFNVWAVGQEWALRRPILEENFSAAEFADQQAEGILRQVSARYNSTQ